MLIGAVRRCYRRASMATGVQKGRHIVFNRLFTVFLMLVVSMCGCSRLIDSRPQQTRDQVRRVAADLDARTTKTGVYVRVEKPELDERDAWGTPLRVTYSQGGVAEMVKVTSAGPDREFGTRDDIDHENMAMNFKGAGEGVRENASSVARDVAKGAVEGVADGVKETVSDAATSVKDAVKKRLPGRKRAEATNDGEGSPDATPPSTSTPE